MDNILNAEDFISNRLNPNRSGAVDKIEIEYASELMIEFAKLHVKAALDEAAEKMNNEGETDWGDCQLIYDAYPLDIIK